MALRLRAQLLGKVLRDAGSNIEDIQPFQTVTQRRIHIGIDRLARLQNESVIALVIKRAQVIRLAVKYLATDRERAIEKPRLRHDQNEILALRAVLYAQSELLTGAGEGRPIHQIEVALCELRETDQLINRAETAAETE